VSLSDSGGNWNLSGCGLSRGLAHRVLHVIISTLSVKLDSFV
jgi:hypothetical protein